MRTFFCRGLTPTDYVSLLKNRLREFTSGKSFAAIPRFSVEEGIAEIHARIGAMQSAAPSRRIIVGIAGESGAGKTFVANKLGFPILSIDEYYFQGSLGSDWDRPAGIDFNLLARHLRDLKEGNEVQKPVYDYHKFRTGYATFTPSPVISLEGMYALTPNVTPFLDIKVYVESDPSIARVRRLSRDVNERGFDAKAVMHTLDETVEPLAAIYVRPTMRDADIIIRNL